VIEERLAGAVGDDVPQAGRDPAAAGGDAGVGPGHLDQGEVGRAQGDRDVPRDRAGDPEPAQDGDHAIDADLEHEPDRDRVQALGQGGPQRDPAGVAVVVVRRHPHPAGGRHRDRPVEHAVDHGPSAGQRGAVDERLDRGADLAPSGARAIELVVGAPLVAADQGADAAGRGLDRHDRALDRRRLIEDHAGAIVGQGHRQDVADRQAGAIGAAPAPQLEGVLGRQRQGPRPEVDDELAAPRQADDHRAVARARRQGARGRGQGRAVQALRRSVGVGGPLAGRDPAQRPAEAESAIEGVEAAPQRRLGRRLHVRVEGAVDLQAAADHRGVADLGDQALADLLDEVRGDQAGVGVGGLGAAVTDDRDRLVLGGGQLAVGDTRPRVRPCRPCASPMSSPPPTA
jgi:hypothetical protein